MTKHKNNKHLFKLDYTTFIITVTACLFIFALFIAGIFLMRERSSQQNDASRPLSLTNITYCNGEKLDLFVPQSAKPVPLIVYIHGGGWRYGSKVGGSLNLIKPLIQNNFAIASINYRLSGSAKFPAQIQDVYCAIRFLRQNTAQYNVDTSRIGLVGISAGAHLAVLAGNADNQITFKKGAYQNQSSKVQAVVSISGLLNLEAQDFTKTSNENMSRLLGGTEYTRKMASPTTYITAGDAPQLLIYSSKDKTVSPTQSTKYADLARRTGLNATLLKVERANHNLQPYFSIITSPDRKELINEIADFFEKQLDI